MAKCSGTGANLTLVTQETNHVLLKILLVRIVWPSKIFWSPFLVLLSRTFCLLKVVQNSHSISIGILGNLKGSFHVSSKFSESIRHQQMLPH